jgi:hypothetical protein
MSFLSCAVNRRQNDRSRRFCSSISFLNAIPLGVKKVIPEDRFRRLLLRLRSTRYRRADETPLMEPAATVTIEAAHTKRFMC